MDIITTKMWIYQAGIFFYSLAAKILAIFDNKAGQFINGRKGWMQELKKQFPVHSRVIWFHCASLGEFEQGRPLIEAWRQQHPEDFILLTFFSPSGYEVRKNYPGADYVCYLPMDTQRNAVQFIEMIKPAKVFFVKYEFWLNYIDQLDKKGIPLFLVSGIFRNNQHFFKWYGKVFRRRLKKFTYFYLQNKKSARLLDSINIKNYNISGDTRFDRVWKIAQQAPEYDLLSTFKSGSLVILAGSTWPVDEKMLAEHVLPITGQNLKLIIAPHQVDGNHIRQLKQQLPPDTLLWTTADKENATDANVLVVDTIGILSSLYRYADIAYVGGGFGKGIHNVLEAATFGIPIIFGPNYRQFHEAVSLKTENAAFPVNHDKEFSHIIHKLAQDQKLRTTAGESAGNYVLNNIGATNIIMQSVKDFEQEKSSDPA